MSQDLAHRQGVNIAVMALKEYMDPECDIVLEEDDQTKVKESSTLQSTAQGPYLVPDIQVVLGQPPCQVCWPVIKLN